MLSLRTSHALLGIAARNDWQGYLDRGETYRRTAIPMMRTAGPRGNVRIDGAAGESYDVKRKRPRRPDIRAVELVALQVNQPAEYCGRVRTEFS